MNRDSSTLPPRTDGPVSPLQQEWHDRLVAALASGDDALRAEILELLAVHTGVPAAVLARCREAIQQAVLSPDRTVRFWAVRARETVARRLGLPEPGRAGPASVVPGGSNGKTPAGVSVTTSTGAASTTAGADGAGGGSADGRANREALSEAIASGVVIEGALTGPDAVSALGAADSPAAATRFDGSASRANGGGSNGTVAILLKKMRLGSRYICFDAIERLTSTHDPALIDPLLEFLGNETDGFKIAHLVKRLGRIRHPRVEAALLPFVGHPDPWVVANALEGLEALGGAAAVQAARDHLDSADHRIRASATHLLWAHDREAAEAALYDMLSHEELHWQASALHVMESIDTEHDPKLVELASLSKYPMIQLRALAIRRRREAARSAASAAEPVAPPAVPVSWPLAGLVMAVVAFLLPIDPDLGPVLMLIIGLTGVLALIGARRLPAMSIIALIGVCMAALHVRLGGGFAVFALLLVIAYESRLAAVPPSMRPPLSTPLRLLLGAAVLIMLVFAVHEYDQYLGVRPLADLVRLHGTQDPVVRQVVETYERHRDRTVVLSLALSMIAVVFGAVTQGLRLVEGRERVLHVAFVLGGLLLVMDHFNYRLQLHVVLAGNRLSSSRELLGRLAVPESPGAPGAKGATVVIPGLLPGGEVEPLEPRPPTIIGSEATRPGPASAAVGAGPAGGGG